VKLRRFLLNLAAPVSAIVFAVVLCSVILEAAGYPAFTAFHSMWTYGNKTSSLISIADRSVPYYLAGLAVAIGFKMNLFNIGVEGQYRLAALVAAAAGAAITMPAILQIPFIMLVAMLVGAAWAFIPAALKVTRGVHEVISTIMLNTIATGVSAYLLATYFQVRAKGKNVDLVPKTKQLPKSGQMPALNRMLRAIGVHVPVGSDLYGFLIVAVLVGVGYYLLVWRTAFGYDLRASGVNPFAAMASGVNPRVMVVKVMLLSGAIAGLVGMSDMLGFFHRYTTDFPVGIGFTGIGVALLGRNHPVGVAIGAFVFAYLDRSAQILDLGGIPREIVTIMQGVILLSVVVAYEVVRRIGQAQETKAAAEAAAHLEGPAPLEPVPA
jgi:general nucleoside transport system permease protein